MNNFERMAIALFECGWEESEVDRIGQHWEDLDDLIKDFMFQWYSNRSDIELVDIFLNLDKQIKDRAFNDKLEVIIDE